MDFFDVITGRHSVRMFQDKEVEEEKIKKILETANFAPSAGDIQAYEIVVVKDKKQKADLCRAALGQAPIENAPIVLVFCANPRRSAMKYGKRGSDLYCIQDATIACAYAQLAVTALGLGCVWIGAFDPRIVASVIGAKEEIPIAILPIGYPSEKPSPTPRRDLDDLVHEGKFK